MKFNNSTKQVFKQSKFFALAFAITVVSCKGPEGEIGPKGDTGATGAQGPQGTAGANLDKAFENGFIKGTIIGIRKDGTAFSESFEYKTAWANEGFEKISDTEHLLELWRSVSVSDDDRNYVNIDLSVTNKDQVGAIAKFSNFNMEFSKLLSDRNLFYIGAGTNFITKNIVLPVSKANNATYKLVDYGLNPEYYQDNATGENFYIVKDTDGNHIYFKC